jgi:Holliday junction DNA helicase RuvB
MNKHTHITTPEVLSEDAQAEPSLRPQRLAEFIGQAKVCESLQVAIDAARKRREPLDHVLFHGPPGLGKTTLASLIAREMGVNFKVTSGPVLEKPADLVGMLTNQREGDVPSSTRSIACGRSSRSSSIRPWRTGRSRSDSPTGRRRTP